MKHCIALILVLLLMLAANGPLAKTLALLQLLYFGAVWGKLLVQEVRDDDTDTL